VSSVKDFQRSRPNATQQQLVNWQSLPNCRISCNFKCTSARIVRTRCSCAARRTRAIKLTIVFSLSLPPISSCARADPSLFSTRSRTGNKDSADPKDTGRNPGEGRSAIAIVALTFDYDALVRAFVCGTQPLAETRPPERRQCKRRHGY
jgi:hypothetical protein